MAHNRVSDKAKALWRYVLAAVLICGLSPLGGLAHPERALAASIDSVSGYGDGSTVVLTVDAQADSPYYGQIQLALNYANGESHGIQISGAINQKAMNAQIDWGSTIGSVEVSGDGDPYYTVTATLPASAFGSSEFTISGGGSSVSSAQLGFSPEPAAEEPPAEEPAADEPGEDDPATGDAEGSEGADDDPEGTDDAQGGTAADDEGGKNGATEGASATASGKISVDGEQDDWSGVGSLSSNDAAVADWRIARDADGNVYIVFSGTATTQWYGDYQWKVLSITQGGRTSSFQFYNFASMTGGDIVMANNANGNTAGPYVVEMMIPASYFTDDDARIEFCGTSVALADVPVLDGVAAGGGSSVYDGIAIDGSFGDWNAVTKYDAWCPNSQHPDCIDQAAVVWDGDMIYVYIHEAPGGSAAGAGSHGNGQYAFVTDLGRQLLISLGNDGTVSGVEGASASHVGAQWEIAIPASNLPEYLDTFSFGLYTASRGSDYFVTDVANLNGQGSGGSFGSSIVVDGTYGDWAYYPHSIIEYATPGTQSGVADSEGALYSQDGQLYAHVVTTMQAHTDNESGGEFLAAVSVAFNGDKRDYLGYPEDGNFYPKYFAVADDGSISVVNEGTHLDPGTYTFFIADVRTDFSSYDFNELDDSEVFGTCKVTVQDGVDEMEYQIDLVKVANYIGADANDFHLIECQFGRLGDEWLSTAGTSTMPQAGIGLGIAVVVGVLAYRRFTGRRAQPFADVDAPEAVA